MGKRPQVIQNQIEMELVLTAATHHAQKMVMRGQGVAHGAHQWGQNGQNFNFYGTSHFCGSPHCKYSHALDGN